MSSKPRNYPTSIEIIQPVLTPEENEAAIKKIQEVLILMAIDYLIKEKENKVNI